MSLIREIINDAVDVWLRERWPAYLCIALCLALWGLLWLIVYGFEVVATG